MFKILNTPKFLVLKNFSRQEPKFLCGKNFKHLLISMPKYIELNSKSKLILVLGLDLGVNQDLVWVQNQNPNSILNETQFKTSNQLHVFTNFKSI